MDTLPVHVPHLSEYERQALHEIALWKRPGRMGWFGTAVEGLNRGVYAVTEYVRRIPGVDWTIDTLVSGLLRLAAWLLLRRVPEPVQRPRLRATFIIRDTVRTLNPTQGFSPLLHVFAAAPEHKRRPRRHRRTTTGTEGPEHDVHHQ